MFSKSIQRIIKDNAGTSAVEYAMVAGLIVVVAIGAVRGLSTAVNTLLASSADSFTTRSDSFGPSSPQGHTLTAPEEARMAPEETIRIVNPKP